MSDKLQIIIADDHPIVRQGLRQVLEREPDFEILVECGDGDAAFDEIVKRQPDVAVLDIDMPRRSGLEILAALQNEAINKTKTILMTVHAEEEFLEDARRLGAQAYILKDSAIEEVVRAIRLVADGQNYVSPALTAYLFRQNQTSDKSDDLSALTPTERQILKFVAEYKTNNQIAETLFISPLTVKTHRRNISQKLDIEGSHALMRFALENKNRL